MTYCMEGVSDNPLERSLLIHIEWNLPCLVHSMLLRSFHQSLLHPGGQNRKRTNTTMVRDCDNQSMIQGKRVKLTLDDTLEAGGDLRCPPAASVPLVGVLDGLRRVIVMARMKERRSALRFLGCEGL